jgi:hypothetical protein
VYFVANALANNEIEGSEMSWRGIVRVWTLASMIWSVGLTAYAVSLIFDYAETAHRFGTEAIGPFFYLIDLFIGR